MNRNKNNILILQQQSYPIPIPITNNETCIKITNNNIQQQQSN